MMSPMPSAGQPTAINPPATAAVAADILREHGIEDPHIDEVGLHVYLHGVASCYKNKQAAAKGVASG